MKAKTIFILATIWLLSTTAPGADLDTAPTLTSPAGSDHLPISDAGVLKKVPWSSITNLIDAGDTATNTSVITSGFSGNFADDPAYDSVQELMDLIDAIDFISSTGSVASATVVSTGFSGNLTTDDDTMQEIANALDSLATGGGNLTTKGDLEVFTTAQTRLAVGTNGQVLTANSAAASGLAWTTPASGAPEGTAVLSTGETGGSKFLREDGDGTSSWQAIPGGTITPAALPAGGVLAVDSIYYEYALAATDDWTLPAAPTEGSFIRVDVENAAETTITFLGTGDQIPERVGFGAAATLVLPAGNNAVEFLYSSGRWAMTDSGIGALIGTASIEDGAVTTPKLSNTGVSPGSYTLASVTVDSTGRITSASNGTAPGDVSTDPIWAAAGDLVYGTGNDASSILTAGSAGALLAMNGTGTAPEWVTALDFSTITVTNFTVNGFVFGGTNFDTTLDFVDPTAARTITFPDATGTVALLTDVISPSAINSTTWGDDTQALNTWTFAVTGTNPALSFQAGRIAASTELAATNFDGAGGDLTYTAPPGTGNLAATDDTLQELADAVDGLATLSGLTSSVAELNFSDGVTSNIQTQLDARAPVAQFSEVLSANELLTFSATTGEGYNSIHYVDTASTVTLDAVTDGCSVTIITIGAIAVTVDVNINDGIMLDGSGTFATDGNSITNSSTAGDMVVFTYYSATGWLATSDGNWTAN